MAHVRSLHSILLKTLASAAAVALLAFPAAAGLEQTRSFDSDRLTVRNLIGKVTVEGHGGSGFEVTVNVQGRDAKDGAIRLEQEGDELNIVFPESQRDYVYPALGSGDSSISVNGSSWLLKLLGGGRINVKGSGKGLELWADVIVRVPSGGRLEIKHGIGELVAIDVDGDLELSTRTGDVVAESVGGNLSIATGSGDVKVTRVDGRRINVATGSGDVEVQEFDGERIEIATGSGDVGLETIRGRSMSVATGSGDVEARRIESDQMSVATGSGSVTVGLDQMGNGDFNVASGSGRIVLELPPGVGEALEAAAVVEDEVFLVESHQVEERRVDVPQVVGFLRRLVAELVRRADDPAPLDAAPREPHRHGARVVVAPGFLLVGGA